MLPDNQQGIVYLWQRYADRLWGIALPSSRPAA